MPVFPISGLEWSFGQDLSDTGAASQYDVTYELLTAAKKWDPTYFNTIRPYRGESNPDLVEIFVEADGDEILLVQGTVDRNSRAEAGAGTVRGRITGRDLMSTLLDRYPSTAFTIQGAKVDDEGLFTYDKTFITAVDQLLDVAGVEFVVDGVLNYKLGASVAVTTDRTFGEVLAELLEPLRWSEKHAVDTWWENGRLYIIGRDTNFRGTKQIEAARVLGSDFVKTALPAASDVRVEGWTYERPVDDIPFGGPIFGMPWTEPYENRPEKRTVNQTVQGREESYTVEEIEFYNVRGQLYSTYKKIVYLSKVRTEEHVKTITFDEDPTHTVSYGNVKEEIETFTLTDLDGSNSINADVVREMRRAFTYFLDNGDTRTMEEFEVQKAETGTSPLAVEKTRVKRELYRRTLGQIKRETEIIEMDADGVVERSFEIADLGPFKITTFVVSPNSGKKMQSTTLSAGAETAPVRFRSDLVGDQTSVNQLRTWLLDEYGSIRKKIGLQIVPKLDIKPACHLDVLNPLTHWDVSTDIFITSVQISRDSARTRMSVEGLVWVAA